MKNAIILLVIFLFFSNYSQANDVKPESYIGQIAKYFELKDWTEIYELTNATLGYQQEQTPDQANIYFQAHSRDQLIKLIENFNAHQHNIYLSYLTVLYFQDASLREGILSIGDEIFEKKQEDIESDEVRSGWNHALGGAIIAWGSLGFVNLIDSTFTKAGCKKFVDGLLSSEKSYMKPLKLSINSMKSLKKDFDDVLLKVGNKMIPFDFYLRPIQAPDKTAYKKIVDVDNFVKDLKIQAKEGASLNKEQKEEFLALIEELKKRVNENEILTSEIVPHFDEFIKKLRFKNFSVEGVSIEDFTKMEILISEGLNKKIKNGEKFNDSLANKMMTVLEKLKSQLNETTSHSIEQIKKFDHFIKDIQKSKKFSQEESESLMSIFQTEVENGIIFTSQNISQYDSIVDKILSYLKNKNFQPEEFSQKVEQIVKNYNSQKEKAKARIDNFNTFVNKLDSEVKNKPNRPARLNEIIKKLSDKANVGENITKKEAIEIGKLLADKDKNRIKFKAAWENFIYRMELVRVPAIISYIPRIRKSKIARTIEETPSNLSEKQNASINETLYGTFQRISHDSKSSNHSSNDGSAHLSEAIDLFENTPSGNEVFKKSMVMISTGSALGYAMYEYDEAYVPRKIRPDDQFHFLALYQIHSLSASACHLREKMKDFDMNQPTSDEMTKKLGDLLAEAIDIQNEYQFFVKYKNFKLLNSIGVEINDKLLEKSKEFAIIDSELFSSIADIHKNLPEICKPSQENPKLSLNGIERDLTIFRNLYIQAMEKYETVPGEQAE